MQFQPTDPEYAKLKEQIIQHYLTTAEGRVKLVTSSFSPVEEVLLHAKDHPEAFTDSTFTSKVHSMIEVMERVEMNLDGSEVFPKSKFEKLLGDLKLLRSVLPTDP